MREVSLTFPRIIEQVIDRFEGVMFIFAANLTKPFETEKKIPRFLAETEDFFFFARKVRSCRVKSHKLRVSDEPEFLCFLVDEDKRSLMVIGDDAVEDGVFESHLEYAYLLARL